MFKLNDNKPEKIIDISSFSSLKLVATNKFESGKYEDALTIVNTLLKTEPNNEDLIVLKSKIFIDEKSYSKAETLLIAYNSSNFEPNFELAHVYQILQEHEKMIDILDELNKTFPDKSETYWLLGQMYYDLKNYSRAKEYFEKSEELAIGYNYEHYECPYKGLGMVYYELGKFNESQTYLEESLSIQPYGGILQYIQLVEIYISQNRTEDAEKIIIKGLNIEPNNDQLIRMQESLHKV